ISEYKCFKDNFTEDKFKEIEIAKKSISSIIEESLKYDENPRKKEFDNFFPRVNFNNRNYSQIIYKIREDVAKTGYDRHFSLIRRLNNALRSSRLSKIRSQLPGEVIDLIDKNLRKDIYKNEAIEFLDDLVKYAQHYEKIWLLENTKIYLQQTLDVCGLTHDQLKILIDVHLSKTYDFETVKYGILKVEELKKELAILIDSSKDLNLLSSNLKKADRKQREEVIKYIENIVNNKILDQWKQGITIKQIIKKLAKAFG